MGWTQSSRAGTLFTEDFDTYPVPPAGWTTSPSGTATSWRVTSNASDTPPNAAFAQEAGSYGYSLLTSAPVFIPTPTARLSFRHRNTATSYYNRGRLEISIAGGEFYDFVTAGGSFLTNGYSPNSYPYGWGPSSGFFTTEAYLPASAAGQTVRLCWRFTRDSSNGNADQGWFVDTISISDGRVLLADDISVTLSDSPDPVAIGANLTYVAIVTNTGPTAATAVVLTNLLPANVALVSATTSRGTCQTNGGSLVCILGTLPRSGSATLTVVLQPTANGILTNRVSVTRAEPDAELPNNTTATTTLVATPSLTVADVTGDEDDAGEVSASFNIFLVPASPQAVTVEFATTNGTATAGSDFVPTNGVLVFTPGEKFKTIRVPIRGDLLDETDETYSVILSNPTNTLLARSQATGTILDDDPVPGFIVLDTWVTEGDGGMTNAEFTIFLTAPSGQSVSLSYSTESYSGTATRESDFPSTNGTVIFPPGSVVQTVTVPVFGDRTVEANETFYVNFYNSGGSWNSYSATVLILNDDGLPGEVDRFVWSVIPDSVVLGQPVPVTLTALDYFNQTATNFTGTVVLSARAIQGEVCGTILPSPTHDFYSSGSYTLGYAFTPTANLVVTHVRHYSGTKVSIWTDDGALLASQTVTSTPRTWMETPLATPIQLTAGVTYRLGVYTGDDYHYYRYGSYPEAFDYGTVDTGYTLYGDGFPQNSTSTHHLVDLRYTVGTLESVALAPGETANFANGLWSGSVAILGRVANVILKADDGQGHFGLSNPFELMVTNDLSISISAAPDPATMGGQLTYAILVTNTGPADATGVTVTNFLPAGATLVSFAASQGACRSLDNSVVCDLGTLPGATAAQLTIVVSPAALGTITNTATVSRAELDFALLNNTAVAVTPVTLPTLSIVDAEVVEGNGGTTPATFRVQLFPACGQTVSVNYATSAGGAASADYQSVSGTLTFAPGETNKAITVPVKGDILNESNEVFTVSLANPVNAVLGRGQAAGTILNDDPQPTLLIYDAAVAEGNFGETNALFVLNLSAPSDRTVTVIYSTYYGGTATPGTDYLTTNGVLVFLPGSTVQTIAVRVKGDTTIESTETFFLNLDSIQNASWGNSQATGFIVNDDGLPGQVHHFTWAEMPSVQPAGQPISVSVVAQDYFSNTASNYAGPVSLAAFQVTGEESGTLLNGAAHSSSDYDYSTTTAGYAFTPNTDLRVTHVRHYSGTKVSIWTDTGILLASQPVASVPGSWGETALANPVWLSAGNTYRIGVYGGRYLYYRTDGPSAFSHGTVNSDCYVYGDAFPQNTSWWRWPMVDLRYSVQLVEAVAITPSVSGAFAGGTWTGSVLVPAGLSLFLRADDGAGHSGVSGLFNSGGTRLNIQRVGDNVVLFWPANAAGFVLESAESLTGTVTWTPCTNAASIWGDQIVVTNPISSARTLFRLRR
ncbi:MAG: DUF11 domain-containing protein [Verrucomicrobia bacterium]|nr:DUF11 domain-containing protein [Verrucomicrobiota bacterium]